MQLHPRIITLRADNDFERYKMIEVFSGTVSKHFGKNLSVPTINAAVLLYD